MGVDVAKRSVTTAAGLDDWPATPDTRYGQLAAENTWTEINNHEKTIKTPNVGLYSNYPQYSYHFDEGVGGVPTGWVVDNAAQQINQTQLGSHFYIRNTSAFAFWRYHALQTFNIDTASPTAYVGWRFHFSFTNVEFTDDLTYRFGFHATDGASNLDTERFIRAVVNWDSAGTQWRVRQEMKDGTTQTDGPWIVLDNNPLLQPMIVKARVRKDLGVVGTSIGHAFNGDAYLELDGNRSLPITWNEPAIVIERSRGAGAVDKLYIDSILYSDTP